MERYADGSVVQRITGTVRWESSDDHACGLPTTEPFTVEVAAAGHNRPEAEDVASAGMNIPASLRAMVGRRPDKSLVDVFTEIAGNDD